MILAQAVVQRERLERRVETHEAAIDQLVYKLFDLSDADIRTVEEQTVKVR